MLYCVMHTYPNPWNFEKMFKKVVKLFVVILSISGPCYAAGSYGTVQNISPNMESAQNFIATKNFVAALNALQIESQINSSDADVWNLLGFVSRKLEKYVASEKAYKRALEIDPNHKGALEYMGELYLTLSKTKEAEDLLGKLKELCPSGCAELTSLAESFKAHGKKN